MRAGITLSDVTGLALGSDSGHRFELDSGGRLWVWPLPDAGHATLVSRLLLWLVRAGWPPDQVLHAVGVRISGGGGRAPDVTVWARPLADDSAVWLPAADVRLAVEIHARGSEAVDDLVKPAEYAAAGIPRYWTVARDTAQTVTMHTLGTDAVRKVPLAWLLQTMPADHGLAP